MMSAYFYPAPSGREPRYQSDELGNPTGAETPRQLSLLDWMFQRNEIEKDFCTDHKN